jgi:hypothetical protein
VEGFGKNGEWKKLEGTCLEKDTGEYVSSSCLVFFRRLFFRCFLSTETVG